MDKSYSVWVVAHGGNAMFRATPRFGTRQAANQWASRRYQSHAYRVFADSKVAKK